MVHAAGRGWLRPDANPTGGSAAILLHVAGDPTAEDRRGRLRNMLSGVLAKNAGELGVFGRRFDQAFPPDEDLRDIEFHSGEEQRPAGTQRGGQAVTAWRQARLVPAVTVGVAGLVIVWAAPPLMRYLGDVWSEHFRAEEEGSGTAGAAAPTGPGTQRPRRPDAPAAGWNQREAQRDDQRVPVGEGVSEQNPSWYDALESAVTATPIAAALGWLVALWWRRRPWRARHPLEHEDRLDAFELAFEDIQLFVGPDMRGSARRLRGGPADPLGALDIERTVNATAARAGLFTPVPRVMRSRNRNLVLVEQMSKDDHLAHLFAHAADRIASDGVPLRLFSFGEDPCVVMQADGAVLRVQDLAAEARQERLVVIGTGDELFHPLTDNLSLEVRSPSSRGSAATCSARSRCAIGDRGRCDCCRRASRWERQRRAAWPRWPDRVAVDRKLVLAHRQRLAGRHPKLPFAEVLAGDVFRNRMLDLEPGVHLHEEERAVLVQQELDRSGPDIADRLGGGHRSLAHPAAGMRIKVRGGNFLHDLLMPALDRAVALEQVDAITLGVGQDLDFDVARPGDVALDQHPVVAERIDRLALGAVQLLTLVAKSFSGGHAAF